MAGSKRQKGPKGPPAGPPDHTKTERGDNDSAEVDDIAEKLDGSKMRTNVPDRTKNLRVHLWRVPNAPDGLTTETFELGRDCKPPCPREPHPMELIARYNDTVPYLEVGMIGGGAKDNPSQQRTSSPADRPSTAVRVFTPFITTSRKVPQRRHYYAGVNQTNGRLHPKVVNKGDIFFYPEF